MNRNILKIFAIVLVISAILSSCKYDEEETDTTEAVAELSIVESIVDLVQQIVNSPSEQQSITIDNFIGREYNDKLYKELVDGYYDVNVEFAYSEEPENTVIAQSIPSGNSKKVTVDNPESYIDITITVSKGIQIYTLPDYSGQRKEEVISDLRSKNLTVNEDDIVTVYSDEYEAGEVISTEPIAGSVVTARDVVRLTVSMGAEMETFTVPDFKNMTRKEVENILEDVKFKKIVYVEEYSDTVEKGCIIEQSQPPETVLTPETSKIEITISLGPDPTKE